MGAPGRALHDGVAQRGEAERHRHLEAAKSPPPQAGQLRVEQDDHGEVPQVDPVRALADPAQRTGTEARERAGERGVGHREHDHREHDGQRQEAPVVQPRCFAVGPEHRTCEDHERHQAGADGQPPPARGQVRQRGERQREGRTDEQVLGTGVRAVVGAGRVGRVVDRGHERRRTDGEQHDAAEDPPPRADEPQRQHEHDRPDDVPLLFDGQRPHVTQGRGWEQRLEVRLVGQDVPPVGDVEEAGHRVAPHLLPLLGQAQDAEGHHDGQDHQGECGHQPPEPARPEATQVDATRRVTLGEQQGGDQVAGDDEEQVDPEEATLRPSQVQVVGEHGQHRQSRGGRPGLAGRATSALERAPTAPGPQRCRWRAGPSCARRPMLGVVPAAREAPAVDFPLRAHHRSGPFHRDR